MFWRLLITTCQPTKKPLIVCYPVIIFHIESLNFGYLETMTQMH